MASMRMVETAVQMVQGEARSQISQKSNISWNHASIELERGAAIVATRARRRLALAETSCPSRMTTMHIGHIKTTPPPVPVSPTTGSAAEAPTDPLPSSCTAAPELRHRPLHFPDLIKQMFLLTGSPTWRSTLCAAPADPR
jgi:hypothetical protein